MHLQYRIIPASKKLRPYVKYFWTASLHNPLQQTFLMRTYVDGSNGIIFNHNQGQSAIRCSDIFVPEGLLYGQATKPGFSECNSDFMSVGVSFYPSTINEFFFLNASVATDQMINLDDLEGGRFLTDNILNSKDETQQMHLFKVFLEGKASRIRKVSNLVKSCLNYIEANDSHLGVRELLQYLKVSERKLERDFLVHIGVTPQHYLQVRRFNKIISLMKKSGEKRLIDIALEMNFFDQQHFNRLIKKFSGTTPKKLREMSMHGVVNLLSTDEEIHYKTFLSSKLQEAGTAREKHDYNMLEERELVRTR